MSVTKERLAEWREIQHLDFEPVYGWSDFTYVDDFCGAGGSSQGLREAGLRLVQAANHSAKAIETHATNFPDADHLTTDLMLYDMRRRPRPDVYWASPECTWHSPAGGRKRKRQAMLDLFDEYVPNEAGERSRLTMMQVIAFAEAKRPKVVLVENVVEVVDWELFETWLAGMTALGYRHQILSVSAAHVWSEHNAPAPQWRDRVYFVFYQKGIDFPNVEPRPWAFCAECEDYTRARQSWKRNDRRRIGKYRQQYVYVCEHHQRMIVEPLVSPAMDALDLSDLGERIGDRKRRLAPATERRIKVGALMFGYAPELVASAGQTYDAASPRHPRNGDSAAYYRVAPVDEPVSARTSTPGDALVHPFLATLTHGKDDDGRPADPAAGPLPTRSTKLGESVVTPFLTRQYNPRGERVDHLSTGIDAPTHPITANGGGNHALVTPFMVERRDYDGPDGSRVRAVDEPMGTRTASDRGVHGLVTPFLSHQYGERPGSEHRNSDPATQPFSTIVATGGHHNVVTPPFGVTLRKNSTPYPADAEPTAAITAGGRHEAVVTPFLSKHHGGLDYSAIGHMNKPITAPMPTVVARPNVSLVTPTKRPRVDVDMDQLDKIDISDFYFRMLRWREHATAQRFPVDYQFTGNSSENTLMAGNAVASNVAHYLGILTRIALGDFERDFMGYDLGVAA